MSLNRYKRKKEKDMNKRLWFIFAVAFFLLFSAFSEFIGEMGSVKKPPKNSLIMTQEDKEALDAKGFQFTNWASDDWKANAESQMRNGPITEIAPNLLAKNYYIILDTSGSMREKECVPRGQSKMDVAKTSLSQWIQNVSGNDNVALMVFRDKEVEEILPLGQNTNAYKKQLMEVLTRETPGGGTPLGTAIYNAHNALEFQARKQLKYGEYNIVIVTDGAASDPKYMREITSYLFKNTPIVIHTIGFCIDNNHVLNQPDYAHYVSAMNTEELATSLQGVLAESETFDISGFEHIE